MRRPTLSSNTYYFRICPRNEESSHETQQICPGPLTVALHAIFTTSGYARLIRNPPTKLSRVAQDTFRSQNTDERMQPAVAATSDATKSLLPDTVPPVTLPSPGKAMIDLLMTSSKISTLCASYTESMLPRS
ncbi:hypothetical protein L596_022454 [Steinernema carpocapsae]|uniref:Uncharacterized protein n=1 Tax=Steinernema carpocapsae TaxID=34508 RepID=A0A4U5MMM1_STECR|nr:hypothetical protein L596_022454 [Steinernema carpocapsae]